MFEKEAEEYIMRKDVITENDRVPFDNGYGFQTVSFEDEVKKAFKDGAEFGYNKANEWHYVKDGDFPKEDDVYLVYTTRGVLLGHYEQGGAEGETDFQGEHYSDFTEYPSEMLFTEDEIIAWKKIVLPELKESE